MAVVPINQVIADARCQSRSGIELGLVNEYAEAIRDGAVLPPLSTVKSGDYYYLYDGFHRIRAYEQVGRKTVEVESTPGDIWDAIERSCAVNAEHGKRRTNEDKHRAVETMIEVMQYRGENWSNSEIARRCAVSESLVRTMRPDLVLNEVNPERTYTDRWGNQSTMNTANIGKSHAPKIDLDQFDGDEDIDEDGVIHDAQLPAPGPGIAPKAKDNYSPSVSHLRFTIENADDVSLMAATIRQHVLPENVNALGRKLLGL